MYFPKPALNENDLAIIERGDTAEHSIEAGQYVSWRGKLGKAVSAILQGATLDDSLFSYDSSGALNNFSDAIKLENVATAGASTTYTPTSSGLYLFGNIDDLTKTNRFAIVYLVSGHTYTVSTSGLGLSADPAQYATKYLYKICYSVSS